MRPQPRELPEAEPISAEYEDVTGEPADAPNGGCVKTISAGYSVYWGRPHRAFDPILGGHFPCKDERPYGIRDHGSVRRAGGAPPRHLLQQRNPRPPQSSRSSSPPTRLLQSMCGGVVGEANGSLRPPRVPKRERGRNASKYRNLLVPGAGRPVPVQSNTCDLVGHDFFPRNLYAFSALCPTQSRQNRTSQFPERMNFSVRNNPFAAVAPIVVNPADACDAMLTPSVAATDARPTGLR